MSARLAIRFFGVALTRLRVGDAWDVDCLGGLGRGGCGRRRRRAVVGEVRPIFPLRTVRHCRYAYVECLCLIDISENLNIEEYCSSSTSYNAAAKADLPRLAKTFLFHCLL